MTTTHLQILVVRELLQVASNAELVRISGRRGVARRIIQRAEACGRNGRRATRRHGREAA